MRSVQIMHQFTFEFSYHFHFRIPVQCIEQYLIYSDGLVLYTTEALYSMIKQ